MSARVYATPHPPRLALWIDHSKPAIIKNPLILNLCTMIKSSKVILSCSACPFDGSDNVYCRTCSIPADYTERETLRQLSDVVCDRLTGRWWVTYPWLFVDYIDYD